MIEYRTELIYLHIDDVAKSRVIEEDISIQLKLDIMDIFLGVN